MKLPPTWKLITAGAAAGFSLLGTLPAAVVTMEDFTGVANGTALTSVANWSLQSGSPDNATVLTAAGYQGPGGNIDNVTLYKYAIPAGDVMTVASNVIGYSVKLQLSATNNYQQAQVLIGKNDGVNGLAVIFNGGTSNVDTDNTIQLSSGGSNWGSITYNTLASSAWKSNDWYQIDFSSIALTSTGLGTTVTGKVSITDVTTSTVFVSNQTITGFGNSGAFNTINSVVVGNKATSRNIHFDDLTATVVPEPAPIALGLFGLAALAFRRWRKPSRTTVAAAGLAMALIACSASARAGEFSDQFTGPASGSPLKEAEGWSLHFGKDGSATIDLAAGFEGQGARIEANEQYRRLIPDDQALLIQEGQPAEFSLKLRIMAPNDGYTLAQVLVGSGDGVHGLAVRFNGGEHDGVKDNFLQVSRGGENWGRITFADFKEAQWQRETWYEVLITGIVPEPGSNRVVGKLTVREADGSKTLLDAVPIESTGNTGAFAKLDTIVVGNCGTARAFDIDDLTLRPAK